MDENRIRTFFGKLVQALKQEFMPQNYGNLEVLNNYEIKKEYNVSVNLTLKCGIRISIICDMNFPSKDGPKLFVLEYMESPIINKMSLEISYNTFYLWSGTNCKVSDLVNKLDYYFQTSPPKKNNQFNEINLMYRDLQSSTTNKLMNANYALIEPYLKKEDLAKSTNPSELPNILRNTIEYKDCYAKLSQFAKKGIDLAGDIKRGRSK